MIIMLIVGLDVPYKKQIIYSKIIAAQLVLV
jgi:hypothetical protein